MRDPSYLYHYTSINSLALILSNRTIRFSSLNQVDDLDEERTGDYGNLGRFCFVSCWTDDVGESIPLWKMYTPDMRGVRIKLPIYPFKEYILEKGQFGSEERIESFVDLWTYYTNKGYVVNPPFKDILVGVQYTDDNDKLFPTVYSESNYGGEQVKNVIIWPLGKFKKVVWQFQKEWRYRLFICPWKISDLVSVTDPRQHHNLLDRLRALSLPFTTLDLNLDENKIKDMEITLGPKTNASDKIIVESLVDKFNPTTRINHSCLSIR
ncbi:hypothetical protein [Sporomusa termitida]|uniref:DUF2971 domain-containing protein n=1 Tax=Sporomusa termitida TaxID=2377 RepID=A0A517DZG1_9FIRM|nr:hypothetical protein [Sporomusa termitida]QDR82743.1 hypothetical protein SPTER_41730 [Sporomusa termitida]